MICLWCANLINIRGKFIIVIIIFLFLFFNLLIYSIFWSTYTERSHHPACRTWSLTGPKVSFGIPSPGCHSVGSPCSPDDRLAPILYQSTWQASCSYPSGRVEGLLRFIIFVTQLIQVILFSVSTHFPTISPKMFLFINSSFMTFELARQFHKINQGITRITNK